MSLNYYINVDAAAAEKATQWVHRHEDGARCVLNGPTLVIDLPSRMGWSEAVGVGYLLAQHCGEQCVAVAGVSDLLLYGRIVQGALVGPNAAAWGQFDKRKFTLPRG